MNQKKKENNHNGIIAVIVIAQFACTSLWFAGNAVITDIQQDLGLGNVVGHLTSAVQFGFIIGSLFFALFTISDRYSPSKVFFVSAVIGALSNLGIYYVAEGFISLISLRFLTGLCLAGIYPVGMKIASDYKEKGLGMALGLLVGALVLGTAFPHLLKTLTAAIPWSVVIIGTSIIAFLGGLAVLLLVPNGPFRKQSQQADPRAFLKVFQVKKFRLAAFGYFGHMWELYAFWAFVPAIIKQYASTQAIDLNVSLFSFLVIAIGGIGCAVGGVISGKLGNDKVATIALSISGICCLLSPFLFDLPMVLFMSILLIWGLSVVADSPQFSTLVAQTAPQTARGTALTIVNSIGFFITIFSIQLLDKLVESLPTTSYLFLAIGPLLGLLAMRKFMKSGVAEK